MDVMYPRCCGLDVHKSSITGCVLLAQSGKPLSTFAGSDARTASFMSW
jgi:transposase